MWGNKIRERKSKTLGNEKPYYVVIVSFKAKLITINQIAPVLFMLAWHMYLEDYSYVQVFVIITGASFLVPKWEPLASTSSLFTIIDSTLI